MKRIAYSFLLILALLPASGFAQGRVMYGITGGVDIGSRYEVPISDGFSSYSTGRNIGALAGFEIGYFNWDHFSYSAQILFDQKGFQKPDYFLSINYVEIPLVIKIPFITGEWKAYIFAGPIFGFRFDGEVPVDIGIYGGIGFLHSFSESVDFFLQAGYAYGLNDVSPINTADLQTGATYYKGYSRDIRINFGVLFGK